MLTRDTAIQLMAEAANLPHGNYVRALSVETVMARCNGVGAEWMEHVHLCGGRETMLQLANRVYGWAIPASVRHDVRYAVGGTSDMRRNDDKCFYEDCVYLANQSPWWSPLRYLRRHQAKRMYVLLRAFGWLAYNFDNIEDREDEEWVADERAGIANATCDLLPATEPQEGTK